MVFSLWSAPGLYSRTLVAIVSINWIKMEQDKTDQILAVLLARMDADKAESMANQREMKASQEEVMVKLEAKMDSNQGKTDANLKAMKAELKA
jgi:hypothetical protein